MVLVSSRLPWEIVIQNENNSVLTAGDVLETVYEALQEPLTREEYFCADEKKRKEVLETAARVCGSPSL